MDNEYFRQFPINIVSSASFREGRVGKEWEFCLPDKNPEGMLTGIKQAKRLDEPSISAIAITIFYL